MPRLATALLTAALFSLLSSSSNAALMDTLGTPDAQPVLMTTYGVDVATRVGLRSVLPPGWTLLLHRDVTLPDTLSWRLGDPWTKALAEFCVRSNVAALLDWDKRQVLLRAESIALEEREHRAELKELATTPLPFFVTPNKEHFALNTSSLSTIDAPGLTPTDFAHQDRQKELATVAANTGSTLAFVPLIRTNPTVTMVEKQSNAVLGQTSQLVGTPEFAYSTAISLNKPSARSVAQAIATRYQLKLVWDADEIRLLGPVTLLANSPADDVTLLQRALGIYSPLTLSLSMEDKVLRASSRVVRNGQGHNPRLTLIAEETQISPLTPAELRGVRKAGLFDLMVQSHEATLLPSSSESVAPLALFRFPISPEVSLEDALARFVRKNGYTLEWRVVGSFNARHSAVYEGASITSILAQLLPKLGLSADVFTSEKRIVVRTAAAANEK
jgi:hypothetical protein